MSRLESGCKDAQSNRLKSGCRNQRLIVCWQNRRWRLELSQERGWNLQQWPETAQTLINSMFGVNCAMFGVAFKAMPNISTSLFAVSSNPSSPVIASSLVEFWGKFDFVHRLRIRLSVDPHPSDFQLMELPDHPPDFQSVDCFAMGSYVAVLHRLLIIVREYLLFLSIG